MIGPARTVAQSLALLETSVVDAAILDYFLDGENAGPVTARLTALNVPYLFHTGSRARPAAEYPGVPNIDKPTQADQLVVAVRALMRARK